MKHVVKVKKGKNYVSTFYEQQKLKRKLGGDLKFTLESEVKSLSHYRQVVFSEKTASMIK